MPWTWRYLTVSGDPASPANSEPFPTQADAESWLGESWRTLLDSGVERVALMQDGHESYTMPLTPA
ncbi:MAG: hypothetical protein WCB04_05160 [Mycobacteriales bacterium]